MKTTRLRDYNFKFDRVADTGWFCGYASVPVVDSQGDTILPGSFQMSLNTRKPVLLWDHDPGKPIGSIRAIKDTKSGLYFEADLNLETQLGKEVYSLIKRGDISGISIGYRPVKGKYEADKVNGGYIMKEVELYEISLVAMPANVAAKVEAVKSGLVERFRNLTEAEVNFLENMLNLMESLKTLDPAQPANSLTGEEAVEMNSDGEDEDEDFIRYRSTSTESEERSTVNHEKSQSDPLADDEKTARLWAALNSLVTKGDNHGPNQSSRGLKQ